MKAANTLTALKSIRAARPDGAPINVILDNLSAHKGADIRRWAKKNKTELCFTPTTRPGRTPSKLTSDRCGSSPSPTCTIPTTPWQTRAPHAYLRRRNADTRHPGVLAAARKERAPWEWRVTTSSSLR